MADRPRDDALPLPGAPRRAFLKALALAPVAAGCASTPRAAAPPPAPAASAAPGPREGGPDPAPPGAGDEDPLAPVRSHPLPMDAEPAFVFRAAAGRPGE
jgi:hypothetical protein